MTVRYRTIVADPPWNHSDGTGIYLGNKHHERPHAPEGTRTTKTPYSSMSLEAIQLLPVETLAADDAHLYLWTTRRFLRASFTVAESWGFEPRYPSRAFWLGLSDWRSGVGRVSGVRRSDLKTDPSKVAEFQQRARKNTKRKPRVISPASPPQRLKVRGQRCVECGSVAACDPAHLTPRSQGGCDEPACVIALCRTCHEEFDRGELDLAPLLALNHFWAERSHMAKHLSFPAAMRRLTGERST